MLSELRTKIYQAIGGQALLFIVIGVLTTIALFFLDQEYPLTGKDIVVEAHGMLFDILLFGIILAIYDRITRHREDVQRYLEEIDDFRGWEGKEATYRIVGNIRRLNRMGVSKLSLKDANLAVANLIEVDLKGSDLERANLQGAKLMRTNLGNIQGVGANFEGCYARGAAFSQAKLSEANFRGAELIEVTFAAADLSHCNLLGARLVDADLREANIEGVDFRGTDLKGAKVTQSQVRHVKKGGGDVGMLEVGA